MFETRVAGTAGQQALWSTLDKAMALAEFTPEGRLMRANANYEAILG